MPYLPNHLQLLSKSYALYRRASEDGPYLQHRCRTGGRVGMFPSERTHASQGETDADAATRQSNQRRNERQHGNKRNPSTGRTKEPRSRRDDQAKVLSSQKSNVTLANTVHGKIWEDGPNRCSLQRRDGSSLCLDSARMRDFGRSL